MNDVDDNDLGRIVTAVRLNGPMTMHEIARFTGLPEPVVSRLVRRARAELALLTVRGKNGKRLTFAAIQTEHWPPRAPVLSQAVTEGVAA